MIRILRARKISLRWWLVVIIAVCWVVPIAIVGGAMSYYITHNINDRITESVTSTVANAVKTATGQVDSAVYASRYATYNTTIKDAYAQYLLSQDEMQLYERISAFLKQQYKYDDKFLLSAFFFCDDPDTVYYTYNETNNSTYTSVKDYRESAHEAVRRRAESLGTDIAFINEKGKVYLVRNLLDAGFKPYGVLVLQLNTGDIFAGLKSVAWESASTVWLDGTAIVLSGEELDPNALGITFLPNSQTYRSAPNISYLYGMKRTESSRISYIVAIDGMAVMQEMSRFQTMLVFLLAAVLPFLVVIIYIFTRNITQPVNRLIAAAKSIEGENYGITVDNETRNAEFSYLTDAFNSMSRKLQYQFNRIYKEELALRDARIMALQSQINPHFLNNTLEIINWEARLTRNAKITHMIEALSSMLNAAADRNGSPIVHLSEEMIYVDAYLYIISERFGKRISITKEVDPSVLDRYVPRLITQPIIENAVEHGIQPRQKGEIIIRAFGGEDALILEVENNGILTAYDRSRIHRLLSSEEEPPGESAYGLGIRNVHQRLRIIYGESSGLSVNMNKEGHTVFRITIAIDASKQ